MTDESDDEPDFPDFGDGARPADDDRSGFERTVPEVFRRVVERAVEAGVERITEAPENLRDLMGDLKMPKEASGYVYDQIDDTKKGIYKIVAKEIRDVIEHINFADEIAEVLTKLQFEVNTTIRFVPNESSDEDEDDNEGEGEDAKSEDGKGAEGDKKSKRPSYIPRPKVVSKVVMKAREALKPKD